MTAIALLGTERVYDTGGASPQVDSHTLEIGGNRMVMIGITSYSTNAVVYTITYGGQSMTNLSHNRLAPANMNQSIWYLLEADMPSTGLKSVNISWTGGTGHQMGVSIEAVENASQSVPSFEYASTGGNVNVIGTDLDSGVDTWSFAIAGIDGTGKTFTHNEGQVEILESTVFNVSNACTSTIYGTSHSAQFTSTATGAAARMARTHVVVAEDLSADRFLVTTVAATSTVAADLFVPTAFSTVGNISVTSAVTTDLHRNRGYVTSLAVTSTTAADLFVGRILQTLITPSATVTGQQINRVTGLMATVTALAAAPSIFSATRPLMSTTAGQLVVSASFANSFNENISSLTPGDYIELFEIDTTVIGGGDVFRFVPSGYDASNVLWQGETFLRFPIQVEGFEWNATSQAPPQPTLTLSNVNKFVLAAVITLGDIVGAKVTRWRTYTKYLDGMPQADQNAHFPPDIFYVQQKQVHTKEQLQWSLSSAMDLPGVRLPKRQILRDQTTGNLYAPGVSAVRFKGR